MIDTPAYRLRRNAFGRLEFTGADGETHDGVVPVRAFPISAADDGVALVDPHGHELAWIDQLGDLPDELRTLVEAELAEREFMPVIRRIVSVSSFATPSTWQVETDRGCSQPDPQGRGRHPSSHPAGAADRRQPRHSLPDPRPPGTRRAEPALPRPFPVRRPTPILPPGGQPIDACRRYCRR